MTQNKNDTIGQYASDYMFFAGDPRLSEDVLGVKTMRGNGDTTMHHEVALFDENEGVWDVTTGRRLNIAPIERQMFSGEDMHVIDERQIHLGRRAIGAEDARTIRDEQAAEKWMQENGLKWQI